MQTINLQRVVAGILVVTSAVLAFLLSQPDVTFDPQIRVILGAANIGVTTLALYLNVQLPGKPQP